MPSYSDSFRIVCILILVLAWVTMALRYVARVQIMNLFRWDDAVATGSLVLFTASCSCALARLNDSANLTEFHALFVAFELLYVLSTAAIKVSFCLTLLPILRNPLYTRVAYAAATLVSAYSIFYFCWSLAKCGRPAVVGECLASLLVPSYIHGGVLIATDLALATVCVLTISALRMKTSTKLSVVLLLLIGSSPFIATILRTYYASAIRDPFGNLDRTLLFGIFTVTEMGICIIAAAATTLRPLFVKLRLISTSRDGTEPHRATTRRQTRLLSQRRNVDEGELDLLPEGERKIYVTREFLVDSPAAGSASVEAHIRRAL